MLRRPVTAAPAYLVSRSRGRIMYSLIYGGEIWHRDLIGSRKRAGESTVGRQRGKTDEELFTGCSDTESAAKKAHHRQVDSLLVTKQCPRHSTTRVEMQTTRFVRQIMNLPHLWCPTWTRVKQVGNFNTKLRSRGTWQVECRIHCVGKCTPVNYKTLLLFWLWNHIDWYKNLFCHKIPQTLEENKRNIVFSCRLRQEKWVGPTPWILRDTCCVFPLRNVCWKCLVTNLWPRSVCPELLTRIDLALSA